MALGTPCCWIYSLLTLGSCPISTATVTVPAFALAFGTQFPDLVDKPLSWTLGVLPCGRIGAHTPLVAVPLLIVLWWHFDTRASRRAWVSFAVGYLTHLASDGVYAVVDVELIGLGYLLWPITPIPSYEELSGIVTAELTS